MLGGIVVKWETKWLIGNCVFFPVEWLGGLWGTSQIHYLSFNLVGFHKIISLNCFLDIQVFVATILRTGGWKGDLMLIFDVSAIT